MPVAGTTAGAAPTDASPTSAGDGGGGFVGDESPTNILRYQPDGLFIAGRRRLVPTDATLGSDAVSLPSWVLGLRRPYCHPNWARWEIYLEGSPTSPVSEGMCIYALTKTFCLRWPIRLYWRPTYNSARAWTGREAEVYRVDYWTRRGWKFRRLGRS